MAGNADLKRMVNMSNVEAVQTAQAAQKAAEQKARQDILACEAEARGKVYTATLEKKRAIKDAKKRVQNAEKSQRTAWGSFIITLFCCLIVHPSCFYLCSDYVDLEHIEHLRGVDTKTILLQDYRKYRKIPPLLYWMGMDIADIKPSHTPSMYT